VLQPLTFTLEYHPSDIKWKWKPHDDGQLLWFCMFYVCLKD